MRLGIRIVLVGSLIGLGATGFQAQSADADKVTFEVASVKPNKLNGAQQNLQCCAGGRVAITSFPLRQLITIAYGSDAIQTPGQIVGGPGWLSDRFDIVGKAEGDLVPDGQGRPTRLIAMRRALLEERFQVKVHTEMRETETYALVLANKDGKLGPRLKPSELASVLQRCLAMQTTRAGRVSCPFGGDGHIPGDRLRRYELQTG